MVGAPNITINLAGRTIAGNGVDNDSNVEESGIDNSGGHANVIIKGTKKAPGRIRGFENGVRIVGGTTSNTVQWINAVLNGDGFDLESSGNTVKRTKALNNSDDGLEIEGGSNNQVLTNVLNNNGDNGVLLEDNQALVRPMSNVIQGNITRSNDDDNIKLLNADNNTLRRNTASASDNDGGIDLEFSNDNLLEFNTMSGNDTHGLELAGESDASERNTVQDNVITANRGEGVHLKAGADDNDFLRNRVINNREDGFKIESDADLNTFDANKANGNLEDGIDDEGEGNDIKNNVANNNGHEASGPDDGAGLGIDANNDATVTGSNNTAIKNDDTDQCEPVGAPPCV